MLFGIPPLVATLALASVIDGGLILAVSEFHPSNAATATLVSLAGQTSAGNPPRSMQSQGTILINHAPESANSLPPGAEVLAPLTSVVGELNSVPVGPTVR